jgi:hypothetical protein
VPTLHLVIGPWATGKSAVVERLVARPIGMVVFDWDLIIPPLSVLSGRDVRSDASTWPGLKDTWLAVIGGILAAGCDVLLFGPLDPAQLSVDGVSRYDVRCAFLDCSDETLRARLESREASPEEITAELAFAASLRGSPWERIDADGRTLDEVAKEVETWVRARK